VNQADQFGATKLCTRELQHVCNPTFLPIHLPSTTLACEVSVVELLVAMSENSSSVPPPHLRSGGGSWTAAGRVWACSWAKCPVSTTPAVKPSVGQVLSFFRSRIDSCSLAIWICHGFALENIMHRGGFCQLRNSYLHILICNKASGLGRRVCSCRMGLIW
jgi:hypothetical protein